MEKLIQYNYVKYMEKTQKLKLKELLNFFYYNHILTSNKILLNS